MNREVGIYEIVHDENNSLSLEMVTKICKIEPILPIEICGYLAISERMASIEREKQYVCAYDKDGNLIGLYLVSVGGRDSTIIYTKEVCTFLLMIGAAKYIMVHNHPNGVLFPSQSDYLSMAEVEQATNSLGLSSIGHFVLTEKGIFDFKNDEEILFSEEDLEW